MSSINIDLNQGQHYIQGQWQTGCGKAFSAYNPATQTIIWQGHEATAQDTARALRAAQTAFENWSNYTVQERISYLKAFQTQVIAHRTLLAQYIACNQGKPLWEANTEVQSVIAKLDISVSAYEERCHSSATIRDGVQNVLHFKPHGVVGVLGAFNFPAHLPNGHIIPALLAGNTVIYKPSELTPAVAQLIMYCFDQANFPAGVVNCIHGGVAAAEHLLNSDIQALYFTGSVKTGQTIHRFFAGKPHILLALEMGGNNPLIVDETGDLEHAIETIIQSTLITTGQRCTAARRLFVPDNAFGRHLIKKLTHAFQTVDIGAYTKTPEPYMGPVISPQAASHHLEAQNRLITSGGQPVLTMQRLEEDSAFLSPGLIDMTHVNQPLDEEIFAPLLQFNRYQHFEEAIRNANRTSFGLAAGLIGNDAAHYDLFYQKIRAGLINWNKPTTGASSLLPFGGVGFSGNHRPGGYFAADYCAYPVASLIKVKSEG